MVVRTLPLSLGRTGAGADPHAAFSAECLRAICEEDHDIGYELMKRFASTMIRRLQEARLKCSDIYRICAR